MKTTNGKHILVNYLRNPKTKEPFGVIVAISPSEFGIAYHYPKARFNKELLRAYAISRAYTGEAMPVTPHVKGIKDTRGVVQHAVAQMEERAKRYFKSTQTIDNDGCIYPDYSQEYSVCYNSPLGMYRNGWYVYSESKGYLGHDNQWHSHCGECYFESKLDARLALDKYLGREINISSNFPYGYYVSYFDKYHYYLLKNKTWNKDCHPTGYYKTKEEAIETYLSSPIQNAHI